MMILGGGLVYLRIEDLPRSVLVKQTPLGAALVHDLHGLHLTCQDRGGRGGTLAC
jgi:hypothetical protein